MLSSSLPKKTPSWVVKGPQALMMGAFLVLTAVWVFVTLSTLSAVQQVPQQQFSAPIDQQPPLFHINSPSRTKLLPKMPDLMPFLNSTDQPPVLSPQSPPSLPLEASIWTTRKLWLKGEETTSDSAEKKREILRQAVRSSLDTEETNRLIELCGKFLYSSVTKGAIIMKPDGTTFVKTGDIDDMWTRDSSVQISLYYNRQQITNYQDNTVTVDVDTNFRAILEGTLRRNAFYIVQDPYANAYELKYKNPATDWPQLKDRVIGRGGWVATRNYELDSGAYFLNQLWDYYSEYPVAATKIFNHDGYILDAVRVLINIWTIEQHHDTKSAYRYFELPQEGRGSPTTFTGMTWTGFRPSDDACIYHYLVPANIHAAAGLERVLELNTRIWRDSVLHTRTETLLEGISNGIKNHGIVYADDDGSLIYAYEVDGFGKSLKDYDDANVPSLLSIPLLGWSGYDPEVYENTRRRLLSSKNKFYYEGSSVSGIGSTHTNRQMVWPMAMVIQALTSNDASEITQKLRELIKVASCKDAMHESVHKDIGCESFSRVWFEWANALFVILVEAALGESCAATGKELVRKSSLEGSGHSHGGHRGRGGHENFYQNKYHNDHKNLWNYQGVQAFIQYER